MAVQNLKDQTKIFLHIPKTAGTTLNAIIWRHYRENELYVIDGANQTTNDFINLPSERKAQIKMLMGHMKYGLHEYFPQPATYLTILRQPISLVFSYYYYLRGETTHPHYHLANSMSLIDYLNGRLDENMCNTQTRMLAGKSNTGTYYECTNEDLESAKQHLKQSFSVVGLTEKFDETLLLLKSSYGWQNLYYARLNVSRKRPSQNRQDPETIEAIKAANHHDLELYRYAQTLFQAQMDQYGPEFTKDIAAFQRKNQRLYPFFYTLWHAERQPKLVYRRTKLRLNGLFGRIRARLQT